LYNVSGRIGQQDTNLFLKPMQTKTADSNGLPSNLRLILKAEDCYGTADFIKFAKSPFSFSSDGM